MFSIIYIPIILFLHLDANLLYYPKVTPHENSYLYRFSYLQCEDFCSSKIAVGRLEERMTLIASILSIEN